MLTVREFSRFLKWTLVGALGLSVKTGVLALARELLGAHYLLATSAAVEAAILHNFCWHQCWTWRDRPVHHRAVAVRLLRFHASTALLAMGWNLVLMRLLVEGIGLHYLLANLLCAPLVGLLNFFIAEFLIFVRPACPSGVAQRPAFFRT